MIQILLEIMNFPLFKAHIKPESEDSDGTKRDFIGDQEGMRWSIEEQRARNNVRGKNTGGKELIKHNGNGFTLCIQVHKPENIVSLIT